MDIVGYSNLDTRRQLAAHQELQALVRSQPEYERASAADDLLCLPTGDGMALVFFREPVAPFSFSGTPTNANVQRRSAASRSRFRFSMM